MAGIALLLDVLNKNPTTLLRPPLLHSHAFFSAKAAVFSAASTAVVAAPFASWAFLSNDRLRIVHCDIGVAPNEDYLFGIDKSTTLQKNPVYYGTKEYTIELKPVLSAFGFKNFALTALRSFLLFYLPLLEVYTNSVDDEDFLERHQEERRLDLVVPFRKSLKQILRETTVITTRRILERFAIHFVSRRTAWKLLKDAPKSAARKAARGMPTYHFIYCVGKTTLRGHCLGVVASWMVQVSIDVCRSSIRMWNAPEEFEEFTRKELTAFLGRRVYITTVRCCSSLMFASVGAGIGAVVFRPWPSTGQWIGCSVGDLAGSVVATILF